MSTTKAPADLMIEVAPLLTAGNFEALWVALLATLPKCDDCGKPSTLIGRPSCDETEDYSCGTNPCHEDMMAGEHEGEWYQSWYAAPWSGHVLAARMSGRLK